MANKILVIDDSRVIRMRVRDMLPQGNFEVIEAQDGVEGMEAIRSQRPNLIMLDFLLPRMSGWEVFQKIQAQADLQRIPLVLMSGRKEEVTEKISEPFEYFEFIEKPFEQKELIEAIRQAMVKARQPRRAVGGGDVQALQQRVAQLETEVAQLKGQMGKLVAFIKKKLQ